MNLLNEEIRCLQQTISVKRKLMYSVENINVKANLKLEIDILQQILNEKLEEIGD